MKRTYEQSLTFFKRNTHTRGEGRELYKTPCYIIDRIVKNLLDNRPYLKDLVWVDPCAGDGRWGKIINQNGIECLSSDIAPLSDNVVQVDFFNNDYYKYDKKYFFIGNPPYSLLSKFINKALCLADSCYFLGGSMIMTGKLSTKVDLLHRFYGAEGNQKDNRSKVSFQDTNGSNVLVWTCGALFNNKINNKFKRYDTPNKGTFRVSVKSFCEEDPRVFGIKSYE